MTISLDLTGTVLLVSAFSLIGGLTLGRFGSIWWFLGAVGCMIGLIFWQGNVAAQDRGWYSVLHIIGILAAIWAALVMSAAYAFARWHHRQNAVNGKELTK